MFDIRLRLYSPAGVKGRVLKTVSIDVTDTYSDSPTLRFTTTERVAGYLPQPFVVAVEYNVSGSWLEPVNGRFIASNDDSDAVDTAQVVNFTGTGFWPWMLAHTYLHWSSSAKNGVRTWTNRPPGYILGGMLDESFNRGWGKLSGVPFLSYDFTDTHDSNGVAWPTSSQTSPDYNLLTPLPQVLNGLVADGLCEYAFDGSVLHLYVTGSGTDHTDAANGLVRLGTKASAAPARSSFDGVFTNLTVVPEKARSWVYLTNTGADASFGRLEATLTLSGIGNDVPLATKLAGPTMGLGKASKRELSVTYTGDSRFTPWQHFRGGDMVQVRTKAGWENLRIVQLVVSKDADGVLSWTAVTSYRFRSLLSKLANRQGNATVGSASGGTGIPLTPDRLSTAGPKGPTGLAVVSNVGVWSDDGAAKANLELGWDAVIQATDDSLIDVDQYELYVHQAGENPYRLLATANTSVNLSLLEPATALWYSVRAHSVGGDWSDFSTELPVTTASPSDVLDAPTAPIPSQKLGVVSLRWDGLLTSGAPPAQFVRVFAGVSATSGGSYTAVGQPLGHAGALTLADLTVGSTYWFKLFAVDRRGVTSAGSAAVSVTVDSVGFTDLDPAVQAAADAAVTGTLDEWAVSGSSTVPPASGWSASTPAWTAGSYIWQRTTVTFGSGATAVGSPVLVTGNPGAQGDPGTPGDPGPTGAAGKGVSSAAVTYQASASGTTPPTGTWLSSVPAVSAGQFLWTRTITTYTDATTSTSYSVGRMGVDGSNGSPGAAGADGQTTYLHVAYATNATGTTGFSTTDPSGKTYMGTYTDFTVADSTNPALYAWSLIKGADGTNGTTGPAGKGISSSVVTYQVSASGTTAPTGTWVSSVPSTPDGQFLWTRTVITFTDAATSTIYSVAKQGVQGATGSPGSTGPQGTSVTSVTRSYQLATSAPATPTTNPAGGQWTTTEPGYTAGKNLYLVDMVLLSNGSFVYSAVSLSSSYTAASQAQVTADSKNTVHRSTAAASGSGVEGDTWEQWSSMSVGGKLLKFWRWSSGAWLPGVLDATYLPQVDIGAGTFGSLAGSRLAAQSVTAAEVAAGAIDAQHIALGAHIPTGGPVDRVPAPLTDSVYWGLVVAGTIPSTIPFYGAPSGVAATSSGLSFSSAGAIRLTVAVPVPASRQVNASTISTAGVTVKVVEYDAAGAFILTTTVTDGVNYTFSATAVSYQIALTASVATVVSSAHVFEVISGVSGAASTRLSPQGLEITGDDGTPAVRIGTWDDNVIATFTQNALGQPVIAASIDNEGAGTFDSVSINDDFYAGGTPLVGSFADARINGQPMSVPFLDRLPRGQVFSTGLGTDGTAWGELYMQITGTTAYQAAGAAKLQLDAGRRYRVTLDSSIRCRWQATPVAGSQLWFEVWMGDTQQVLTAPNGVMRRWRLLDSADGGGTGTALRVFPIVPSKPFAAPADVSGYSYMLARFVRVSSTTSYLIETIGGASENTEPTLTIEDVGSDDIDPYVPTTKVRTTSGTPVTPGSTTTVRYACTFSQSWGSSGYYSTPSSDTFVDSRLLHQGQSLDKMAVFGWPALGLSGKNIVGARVQLRCRFTGLSTGATVELGTSTYSSAPGNVAKPTRTNAFNGTTTRNLTKWYNIPLTGGINTAIASGSIRALTLGSASGSDATNAIFDGQPATNAYGTSVVPVFEFTYEN